MDRVIAALTELVTKNGQASRKRPLEVDVRSAPPSVQALAQALATHDYNLDFGELSMDELGDTGQVTTLASTIQASCERSGIDLDSVLSTGGPDGSAFDPEQTLQLGADAGGMSYFGLSWSDGEPAIVVVEFDDPTEDNLLRFFTTPEALFAFVSELNRRERRPLPALDALKAAAGMARRPRKSTPKKKPTSGLVPLKGKKPAHPFARALEHFGRPRMVFQAGPTAAGRYLLGQRAHTGEPGGFGGPGPRIPAALVVVSSKGLEHTLECAFQDMYGACAVPGRERALLCTGVPGPLVEIDLETGAARNLLPAVRWSCGFVDADHLAVLADSDEVRIYRYTDGALGEPVAAIAAATHNIFVGHGRVFHLTSDAKHRMRVIAWNGRELAEEGVFAVSSKVFTLQAALEHQGQRLVAFVDVDGNATWLAYL